jgi:hypothetical protein
LIASADIPGPATALPIESIKVIKGAANDLI